LRKKIEKSTVSEERRLFLCPCKNILAPTVGPRNRTAEEVSKDEQSGEQGDNQNVMSMAMLIQLQREFETLKKS